MNTKWNHVIIKIITLTQNHKIPRHSNIKSRVNLLEIDKQQGKKNKEEPKINMYIIQVNYNTVFSDSRTSQKVRKREKRLGVKLIKDSDTEVYVIIKDDTINRTTIKLI